MAKLFFSLRGVPQDEAEDVRELLDQHDIDFYETSAGNWGISMPALWLKNDDDLATATQLLQEYQQKRCIEQRAIYEQLKREGKQKKLTDVIFDNPLQFILYTAFIIFILYISIKLVRDIGL